MVDYIFFVTPPKQLRTGGWQFSVGSQRLQFHGPYGTYREAIRQRDLLRKRWERRAEQIGGTLRLEDDDAWVLRVPEHVPVQGLRWRPADRTRKGRDPRDDPPLTRPGPWKIR